MNSRNSWWWLTCLALLCPIGLASADESGERETLDISGHVKVFSISTFPYDSPVLPQDNTHEGSADGRLKLLWRPTRSLRIELHPTLTAMEKSSFGSGIQSGVGHDRGEAIPMSHELVDNSDTLVLTRLDRANLRWDVEQFRFTFGRQPVTFGTGQIFTPLDLVAPFLPTTLDTSYKPGVDALRADIFRGTSGRITFLAAYLNDWDVDGSAFAMQGQGNLGNWQIEGFAGSVYGDMVLGSSVFFDAGELGYYGDLNLTLAEDENFIRVVAGALYMPTPKTTITTEVYGQTLGASDPERYLAQYIDPRYQRGELWLLNKIYAAAAGQYELTPLLHTGGALILNPSDYSLLLMPNLNWSAAENIALSAGLLLGIGQRPEGFVPRSEFGLVPNSFFAHASFYF